MVEELDFQGICCTCKSRFACLSLRNSLKRGEPILHCESFDDSEGLTNSSRKLQRDDKATGNCEVKNGIESIDEKGLCMNCENDPVCGFPDSGNSVVHCEEHVSSCLDDRKVHRVADKFGTRPCFGIKDLI